MHKLLVFCMFFCGASGCVSYVTYGFSGGRLGDNLVSYAHAKWVAYKYGLTMLYKPFPYSDQLKLHNEVPLAELLKKSPKLKVAKLTKKRPFLDNSVYELPYFPECVKELHKQVPQYTDFLPDWNDVGFLKELRSVITPLRPSDIQVVIPPHGMVAIALHVRVGSGGDMFSYDKQHAGSPLNCYADLTNPGTFPPVGYYIGCMRSLVSLFPLATNFFVYVFTDHSDPQKIMEFYQKKLCLPNAIFACGIGNNRHHIHVLDDLFSMAQFQYLVMPASNLSFMASKLGNFSLVLQPAKIAMHYKEKHTYINKVKWTLSDGREYVVPLGRVPRAVKG